MREKELEIKLMDAVEKTEIGEEVSISFSGITFIVDIVITVSNGWKFFHTVRPGGRFKMIRGSGEINIDITILPGTDLN